MRSRSPLTRREFVAAAGALLAGCAGLPVPRAGEEAPPRTTFSAAVPYVPTRPEIVRGMLELAQVTGTDVVYDLGCGDGRIVITAAKERGASGLGVDIQPGVIDQANAQAQYAGASGRVKFMLGDLFVLDLRPATVVMLYLSVELNVRLIPRLKSQLRPGSRIVSNRFGMGDVWRPERTVVIGETPLHLWRIA